MKKTITITERQSVEREVEVEFPIYREHGLEYGTYYSRIDEDGNCATIHIGCHGDIDLEISKTDFKGDKVDYMLGRGMYASSEFAFLAALAKAKEFLLSMGARNHTQQDVYEWVRSTFGEQYLNDRERALRFIEEAAELVQAIGLSKDDVDRIVAHVYGRPVGDCVQEAGGVMITLEALAAHLKFDLETESDREWCRIKSLPQSHFDAAVDRKAKSGVLHTEGD